MNKEQKTRRNGEMQEEKNERISEEKKVGERTGTGYVLGTIISILSGIISGIALRIQSIWCIALIIVCLIIAGVLIVYVWKRQTELKLISKILCILGASVCVLAAVLVMFFCNGIHVHIWSTSIEKEATCVLEGEKKKSCNCGTIELEIIDKLGHTWKAATCTEAKACQRCDEIEGSALGHDWKEATCTEAKTCQRCGEVEGSKLGHNWKAATCTEAKTCQRCGEVEGSALGHDWNEVSCTEAKECKRCGVVEKPALGHKWVEATCMEAKTCQQCGEVEGTALGHNWADATCTEAKTCRQCGEVTGIALGHDWNDATCTEAKTCRSCGVVNGIALGHDWDKATCTEAKSCLKCGTIQGEATGHDWNEATCITARKCEVCGVTEGVALGHKYDSDTDLNCNVCNYVRGYWSDYGEWSAWQDEVVIASEKRQIEENPRVIAGYNKKTQWKYNRYWGDYKQGGYYLALGYSSGICTNYEETEWLDYPLEYKSHTSKSGEVSWGYGMNDYGTKKYIHWYNEQTQEVDDLNSPIYKTQYRYRDRYIIYY